MKKLILCLVFFGLISSGCIGTKDYYNAQTAYYNAQAEAQIAHIEAQKTRQPLAEMVAPDGTRFVVNQTASDAPPVISTVENPIVAGLKTIVNSTPVSIIAGGWSATRLIKASTGDINANDGSTVTSTANSNNETEVNNADEGIARETDSSTDSRSEYDNSTADPTVVNQPEPIVVEQPEPVIVEQVNDEL